MTSARAKPSSCFLKKMGLQARLSASCTAYSASGVKPPPLRHTCASPHAVRPAPFPHSLCPVAESLPPQLLLSCEHHSEPCIQDKVEQGRQVCHNTHMGLYVLFTPHGCRELCGFPMCRPSHDAMPHGRVPNGLCLTASRTSAARELLQKGSPPMKPPPLLYTERSIQGQTPSLVGSSWASSRSAQDQSLQ